MFMVLPNVSILERPRNTNLPFPQQPTLQKPVPGGPFIGCPVHPFPGFSKSGTLVILLLPIANVHLCHSKLGNIYTLGLLIIGLGMGNIYILGLFITKLGWGNIM
jgi:hypothetical protein